MRDYVRTWLLSARPARGPNRSDAGTAGTRLCLVLVTILAQCLFGGQSTFSIGEIKPGSGEEKSGFLDVPGTSDDSARIPIALLHGAGPGPTIVIAAGIHGTEYAPIIAVQHLAQSIDPHTLKGNIIFVHIANPPSFFGRAIYYTPADHLNPNRAFPGNAHGTLTERIAWVLATQVVEKCNYLVDIHAGEANESLVPYVAYGTENRATANASEQMAISSDFIS